MEQITTLSIQKHTKDLKKAFESVPRDSKGSRAPSTVAEARAQMTKEQLLRAQVPSREVSARDAVAFWVGCSCEAKFKKTPVRRVLLQSHSWYHSGGLKRF